MDGWVDGCGGVPTAAGTMGVGGEGAWKESQTDRAAARRPLVKGCKLAEDDMGNQIQDGKMLEGKLDLVADAKGLHSDGVRR